jgi:Rieske 2Fe-2S family protein
MRTRGKPAIDPRMRVSRRAAGRRHAPVSPRRRDFETRSRPWRDADHPHSRAIASPLWRASRATLLREFYSDPAIFARDLERIHLRHWLCVGHESRIPKPGDWFVFELANESLIIVRGRDGQLRALVNVCRHRGSQVCYEKEGSSRAFVCPYHAWTYDLDGRLRSARLMGPDFDASQHSLAQIHVRVLEGLIFVCFASDRRGSAGVERTLAGRLGARLGEGESPTAPLHRAMPTRKLVTGELECYHAGPRTRVRASTPPRPGEVRAAVAERAAAGRAGIDPDRRPGRRQRPGPGGVSCFHDATYPAPSPAARTAPGGAADGDFAEYDGGFSYVESDPRSCFLAYSDYGVMYLFIPRAPQRTDMEVVWLVREDAREGVDYDRARLTWMWDVTSIADKRIIEHNQLGVNSRYYRPGPYGPMEPQARKFSAWYLDQIRPDADAGR